MSVYIVDIPLVIKKSKRSGILLSSVGQYVGDPVDRKEVVSGWAVDCCNGYLV